MKSESPGINQINVLLFRKEGIEIKFWYQRCRRAWERPPKSFLKILGNVWYKYNGGAEISLDLFEMRELYSWSRRIPKRSQICQPESFRNIIKEIEKVLELACRTP